MPWFHERGMAMLGTGTPNDATPPPHPGIGNAAHVVELVAMSLRLTDNANLEELAQACEALRRWEFIIW